ncbi:MAG TPA: proline--tRNA ligase [Dehalococcoidia bacterium]|nr:proline--tRNA ligase [Dehalococcoidia bacterium]
MRMSHLFGRTLRQAPAEAETANHQLMLRAGLVTQLAAGIYSYLPLGWRALRKIEQIVREEMDRAGGQEVHLPALHPAELWEQSGRRASMGDVLFQLKDRRDRELVLGPTHEEVIVDLFKRHVQSYRELPLLLYQIQTKFRDEPRPRGGLVRTREFTMMDLYSFDVDWDGLDRSYDAVCEAYRRAFERCGLPTIAVLADSGAIGGKDSQEFMYLTDVGEDEVILCPACGYAANTEKADHRKLALPDERQLPLEEVATPGQRTIDDLVRFLGVPHHQTLKAVFYEADSQPVFVAIRGDLQVNETKLRNALKAKDLRFMDDARVEAYGLVAGSAGPVGLRERLPGVRIVADDSAVETHNLVTGANREDTHLKNVNYGRDWTADIVADISLATPGAPCPRCEAPLESRRGIEMGHVFKLGTIYSEAMDAVFLAQDGTQRRPVMGCYGIGIGRILAGVIEEHRDERGIVWPLTVAPYHAHVVALGVDQPDVREAAEALVADLEAAGVETLYDDRDERPGVKFNDADLIGLPFRLTVSPRTIEKGAVEFKRRADAEAELVAPRDAVERVASALREAPLARI